MKSRKRKSRLTEAELEDLHLENEMMKLKLQAETGARIGVSDQLSPVIENIFLRQVQEFEEAMRNAKTIRVSELLGNPAFKNEEELSDEELKVELKNLTGLMSRHQVVLNTLHSYDDRTMYRFITKELFEMETDDIHLPGFIRNFTYESFYPNHKSDLVDTATDFFYNWFWGKADPDRWEFSETFFFPGGKTLEKEAVLDKLEKFFACFKGFTEKEYSISATEYSWDNDEHKGSGKVCGQLNYAAQLESNEIALFQGPFELNMINVYGLWQICYFSVPGFEWEVSR